MKLFQRWRSKCCLFRIGKLTVWFFPFWWGDYECATGSGLRAFNWVVRP